jgi:hypothetical protein
MSSTRFCARLARTHLERHHVELVTQIRMRVMQVFANPRQRLVQRESNFHADDRQIERIG